MEHFLLVVFLIFIAWQIITIRKEKNSESFSTTLFLTIDSIEEDQTGVPMNSSHLRKKTKINFAIVPNMEFTEPGEIKPFQVTRVLFDNIARGVHLKPLRVPLTQLERTTNSYLKSGWQDYSNHS